jgi:hypothetical protein
VFVNEADAASFTATAGGAGAINLTAGGTLTVAGLITSGTGAIDLTGSSIAQNANVTTGGAGSITATATTGGITMGNGRITSAAGTGAVSYQAPGIITLGLLSASGGAVTVNSTGGSILDGNAGALNILAGTGATLNAGGVIGLLAAPIDVNVGGQVNVNALGSVFNAPGPAIGTSINMAGVDADNTLHFPPTVTGQIFWNGMLLWPLAPPPPPVPSGNPGSNASGLLSSLRDALARTVLEPAQSSVMLSACEPGAATADDSTLTLLCPADSSPTGTQQ